MLRSSWVVLICRIKMKLCNSRIVMFNVVKDFPRYQERSVETLIHYSCNWRFKLSWSIRYCYFYFHTQYIAPRPSVMTHRFTDVALIFNSGILFSKNTNKQLRQLTTLLQLLLKILEKNHYSTLGMIKNNYKSVW